MANYVLDTDRRYYVRPSSVIFKIYRILKKFCVSLTTPKGYRVHEFGGEKFVRLAETSWMGGRSLFLGSAYCIVGFFCLVAAIFFGVISRKTRALVELERVFFVLIVKMLSQNFIILILQPVSCTRYCVFHLGLLFIQ